MMTVQRQYSLPNCTLTLEGLGDDSATASATGRPPLTLLTQAECRFVGFEQSLSGGRDFFESLIAAANRYAQECLSGVSHNSPQHGKSDIVQLHKTDTNVHRLIFHPKAESSNGGTAAGAMTTATATAIAPIQLDLKTLHVFDLVEAVDQFFADAQTLPDWKLTIEPISKRDTVSQEPIAKRVVPAAIGVSSLAVAATALFFLPVPEVRRPEPEPTTQASPTGSPSAAASPTEGASPPPQDASASPAASATPSPESPSPESPSPEAASPAEPSPVGAAEAGQTLERLLNSAPEIADTEKIDQLVLQVRNKISEAWTRDHTFNDDLIYRLGVAENGDILGFKQTNQAAIDFTNQTPLLDLLYRPVEGTVSQEPIVQLRVVFRSNGVVEVSPWNGRLEPSNP
ncbi:MAG TPA: DUF4335 domain-containing protein [Chroococcidiopsis sp.]